MALTAQEEAKVRAIIAIYDGMAPSLSDDVASNCPALFPEWNGNGHAYARGERVTKDSVLYVCLQNHVSQSDWAPKSSNSLWAKVLEAGNADTPSSEVPAWQQPESTNPYPLGARVKHKDKVWESIVANNVWEPGAVGTETVWREVAEG